MSGFGLSDTQIELAPLFIKRCIQDNKTMQETIDTLSTALNIPKSYTQLVWRSLEFEDPELFQAYYGNPAEVPPYPAEVKTDLVALQRSEAELAAAALVPLPDDDDGDGECSSSQGPQGLPDAAGTFHIGECSSSSKPLPDDDG